MIKEIYIQDESTEYLENTCDDRTFTEILMTIWSEAEKRIGYPRWMKEDIEELMRRYAPILENVDAVYLGVEVDE